MGKTEKLVVLAVVFIAALVLALAFTRGGDEIEASNPLSGAQRILDLGAAGGDASDAQGTPSPSQPLGSVLDASAHQALPGAVSALGNADDTGATPSLLLNAGAESEGELGAGTVATALALEPQSDPSRPILLDTRGLRPSFLEDYMTYTLAEGDTWTGLAQRFYQDGRYTRNLHLANEDLEQLTPGKDILVPVFDFLARDAGLQPGGGAAFAEVAAAPTTRTPAAEPAPRIQPLEYEVRAGDTLSDISLAVFGTATRWKEILEANRDRLQKPESLQVGMRLNIPAGGKPPAVLKQTEAKPKPKPKPAETEKTASTSKKKKVL